MAKKKHHSTAKKLKAQRAKLRKQQSNSNRLSFDQLEARNLLAADFGDAPFPYPVTIAENGAQHTVGVLRLGSAAVDMEADGTHSPQADFDDLNGSTPDDEDGVTFGTVQVGAIQQTVTVNVQGAGGKLDAWIDFNGDGNWGGPGEQVFASQSVSVGDNNLTFDVPSGAVAGQTFARFRVSTAGDLGVIGLAADGEVEDHVVAIDSPVATSGTFSVGIDLPSLGDRLIDVYPVDMDGDGDMDLLSASSYLRKIAWFENAGNENFVEHLIVSPSRVTSVVAADVDGDGDMDVVASQWIADSAVYWFENDGSQTFTRHSITTSKDGARDVLVVDLNGDGDLDVLSFLIMDDTIAWYENDGSQNFTEQVISSDADGPGVAVDMDGDGDLDVLSGGRWYENDGSQGFTGRDFGSSGASARPADLDGDGDVDIVSRFSNGIIWYENDGNQNFEQHIITSQEGVGVVQVNDLDGDGDLDLLVQVSLEETKIAWFENDGQQNFVQQLITDSNRATAIAADVDGDGDLDVLRASWDENSLTWYENLNFGAETDFGDSPLPYPTLLGEDGARHFIRGPILGATRDAEGDGNHSANSTGDGADDDGVTFGSIKVGALTATVDVDVQFQVGKLDAWIDFNRDGYWGVGEQIFVSQDLALGKNVLTFALPAQTVSGQTFARFRLSTAGGLGVIGLATDGEVEDYELIIAPPELSTGVFDVHNIVSDSAESARSVFGADVDGDGDLDVISASYVDNKIAWYENDGFENFVEHGISVRAYGAKSVYAVDVDGDGDMDVLSASSFDDKIAWYENDGNEIFIERSITTAAIGATSVIAADLDGDGDLDVLSSSANNDEITWYENDGDQNFIRHNISNSAGGAQSVFAADVDSDGDLDVLSASANDDKIAWYENDGSQNFTTHVISVSALGASSVIAADLDNDGDFDVLSASFDDDKVAWYENDGDQNFTEHVISSSADGAQSVYTADFDGDGDLDVVNASTNDDKIAWYENDGSQNFTTRLISQTADGAYGLFVADVDGDGDIDVLSASAHDDTIAWYENRDIDRDFGDAPLPYPTTVAENGPRHNPFGPTLGASRDGELDGAHSGTASSDGADENGITIGTIQIDQLSVSVVVNVQGGAGRLDAWIDFDQDGNWGGLGEQIFVSRSVGVGDNVLTFDVPSHAIAGDTIARFRLSTAGNLNVVGIATDGEVEDYLVTIDSPTSSSGSFSEAQEIAGFGDFVFAADIDTDGDMDLFAQTTWYENDGSQGFTAHHLVTSNTRDRNVIVADMDGDGDMDLVNAEYSNFFGTLKWYENNGSQVFTDHLIDYAPYLRGLTTVDLDGDGDMDLLTANRYSNGFSNGAIFWYENDGNQNFALKTISTSYHTVDVVAVDVDGDGDMDVVSAADPGYSIRPGRISWHENDGNQNFIDHTISTSTDRAYSVYAVDLDGDGDIDVLSASRNDNKIAWYENDGGEFFVEHTITTLADGATSVHVDDLDGDGDLDVLSTSVNDDTIAWYVNDGNQNFVREVISTTVDGALNAIATDLDGDGDLDVVGSTFNTRITWYENISDPSFVGSVFYNDSDFDSASDIDAIDPTKTPLRNGQIATFANYTSFSKGINGLVIEVEGLATDPTLATVSNFFSFKVGNNNSPSTWANAPLPIGLAFESDDAENVEDRIILTWADNAIENTWLQVSLLANDSTGRDTPDTFYLGNAIAETGNDQANATVNLVDVALARSNQTGLTSAALGNRFDFNRDGRVNLIDVAIARSNQSGFNALQLIDLSNVSKGSDFAEKPVSDESVVKGSVGMFDEVTTRSIDRVVVPSGQIAVSKDAAFGQLVWFELGVESQFDDHKSMVVDPRSKSCEGILSLELALSENVVGLEKLTDKADSDFSKTDSVNFQKKQQQLDLLIESFDLQESLESQVEFEFEFDFVD